MTSNPTLDKYKKAGQYPMPDRSIDPKLKTREYYLQMGNAALNLYTTNQCSLPYQFGDDQRSFEELRLYADGKQPISKYKNIFYPDGSFGQRNNKNMMNISWDTVKILPKFKNVAKAILLQREYEPDIQAIDPTSENERVEEAVYLKWKQNNVFNELKKSLGMDTPRSKEADQKYPQFTSNEQIDVFVKAGGLKLDREIKLYQLLKATDYESGNDVLHSMHVNDLLDIGFAASDAMPDPVTRKVLKKYVDPARMIIRFSRYPDHRDVDFAGYCEEMTMNAIREYNPLSGDPITNAQLMDIAKQYGNMFDNNSGYIQNFGAYNQRAMEAYYSRFQCYPWDANKCTVMTLYFVDQDVEKYTEMVNPKYNSTMRNKVDYSYKLKEEDKQNGKKVLTYKPSVTRFVKFIVGTDYILDYGVLDFCPRDASQNSYLARTPIQFYRVDGPSFVDSCVTYIDDLQLSVYKYRDAKAKMPPPPRMVINETAVTNVSVGGVKMQPADVTEMLSTAGFTYIKNTDDFGNPNVNTKAFDFLPSGFSEDMAMWVNDIQYQISQIASVTGINDITAGQTPKQETLVGVAEIAVQASNNALYNIMFGYEQFYKLQCNAIASMWQSMLLTGSIRAKYVPAGESTIKVFEATGEKNIIDLGIMIEPMPTTQERNMMLQEISALKQQRRANGGQGGISAADYLLLSGVIKGGNIKLAQLLMAQLEAKQIQEDMQIAQENSKVTAGLQMQSAAESHKNKMAEINAEGEWEVKKVVVQEEERRKTIALERGLTPETPSMPPQQPKMGVPAQM